MPTLISDGQFMLAGAKAAMDMLFCAQLPEDIVPETWRVCLSTKPIGELDAEANPGSGSNSPESSPIGEVRDQGGTGYSRQDWASDLAAPTMPVTIRNSEPITFGPFQGDQPTAYWVVLVGFLPAGWRCICAFRLSRPVPLADGSALEFGPGDLVATLDEKGGSSATARGTTRKTNRGTR